MVFIAFNSHKRAQSYAYRNKGKTNKKRREWHNLLLTILIISFVAFLSYKQNRIGYVRMEYLRERMNRQRFYTKSELCILTVYDISCIFHSEVKAHSLKNLVKVWEDSSQKSKGQWRTENGAWETERGGGEKEGRGGGGGRKRGETVPRVEWSMREGERERSQTGKAKKKKRQFKVVRICSTSGWVSEPSKPISTKQLFAIFLLSRKMQYKHTSLLDHVFFVHFILSLNTCRLAATINQRHNSVRFVF